MVFIKYGLDLEKPDFVKYIESYTAFKEILNHQRLNKRLYDRVKIEQYEGLK